MDNLERSKLLFNNYKKALNNLNNRINSLNKAVLNNDDEQIDILRESIVQNNEVIVELSWKLARNISLVIEPNGKIAGSTTAIKHALRTEVIESEELARSLIEAIQARNLSSHEYLLETGLNSYVENIITKYINTYNKLVENYEKMIKELTI